MVYYPLSMLMLVGIREIMLISTPHDMPRFHRLLGDGAPWGIRMPYTIQESPDGIARALTLSEEFLAGSPSTLVLGYNQFHGHDLDKWLKDARADVAQGATGVAYHVHDPERYGVVAFDASGRALSLEEKPKAPRSDWAVTGLYVYDGRGYAWLDTCTHDSLLEAGKFVLAIEKLTGQKVAAPEEITWRMGFIDDAQLAAIAAPLRNSGYGRYLEGLQATEGKSR